MENTEPNLPLIITVQEHKVKYKETDKNLLACLESQGVEVHYHCRDGFCGACRVKLNDGEIHYPEGEPLAFIGDNEILPCCCIPVSDINISIE